MVNRGRDANHIKCFRRGDGGGGAGSAAAAAKPAPTPYAKHTHAQLVEVAAKATAAAAAAAPLGSKNDAAHNCEFVLGTPDAGRRFYFAAVLETASGRPQRAAERVRHREVTL